MSPRKLKVYKLTVCRDDYYTVHSSCRIQLYAAVSSRIDPSRPIAIVQKGQLYGLVCPGQLQGSLRAFVHVGGVATSNKKDFVFYFSFFSSGTASPEGLQQGAFPVTCSNFFTVATTTTNTIISTDSVTASTTSKDHPIDLTIARRTSKNHPIDLTVARPTSKEHPIDLTISPVGSVIRAGLFKSNKNNAFQNK